MSSYRPSRRAYLKYGALLGISAFMGGCGTLTAGQGTDETGTGTSGERSPGTSTQQSEKITSDEYEIVQVESDETFTIQLSSGESFTNKLIDISASGATFDIDASGSNWVIRNIGIKGEWDQFRDIEPLSVAVGEGATGVIENYYFADGAPDDDYPGVTGIYVKRRHAGTLRINQVNIQDMPDNAIYASTPGYPEHNEHDLPPGGNGVVEITNSYAANCKSSHFRIGTSGSFVDNCVAVGGHRGLWARFNVAVASNCSFSGGSRGDVAVGAQHWEKSYTAAAGLQNCRYETINRYWDDNRVIGRSAGEPRTDPPDGVPLSAEEAAGPT